MTVSYQAEIAEKGYNGWANYETWNVALWIQNDERLYHLARELGNYEAFVDYVTEGFRNSKTPDGVKWNSKKVNQVEIAEMFEELWFLHLYLTHTLINTHGTQHRHRF